ncbi:lipopolysaccharide biosynthesis protein [Providencia huaxiensis]|uniref:Lipopolysaccharide biosynthesis protein n=1 Tax=Providencia rettgeri TaxID=587 RepID=A0AAD2ZNQ8_PRORE|nr:lipopolysaccharide biosynthesis protein [Providencia rettgeri]
MNFVWISLEKFGTIFIKIIGTVIFARILTPSDFGVFSMTIVIVSISSVLVDAGIVGALIRKPNICDSDYSTAFILNFAIAIFLYLVLFSISNELEQFYDYPGLSDVFKVTSLVLLIRSTSLVSIAILNIKEKFKCQANIYLISSASSVIISIFLAKIGFGYWALVAQLIIEALISSVLFNLKVKFIPRLKFDRSSMRYFLSFGLNLTIASLIQSIYENLPNIIIGRLYTSKELGYYSQANKLNFLYVSTTRTIIDKATFPSLSKKISIKDEFKIKSQSTIGIFGLLSFFISIILVISSKDIITILLGKSWEESSSYFSLLVIASCWMINESISRTVLKSLGLAKLILKLELIKRISGIITLIFLSYISVELMLTGYIILAIISKLINEAVLLKLKIIELKYILVKNSIYSAASLISLIIYESFEKHLESTPITNVFLSIAICTFVFGIVFIVDKKNYVTYIKAIKA